MQRILRIACVVTPALGCAGCWVDPADPARLTEFAAPVFPAPDDWPTRATAIDPTEDQQLPAWVTRCGCAGNGFLYLFESEPPDAGYEVQQFLYLSSAGEGASEAGGVLTRNDLEWTLPPTATTSLVVISTRTDRPVVGTCLYLASLVGVSHQELPVIQELSDRGWRMVLIWPSFQTYGREFFALSVDQTADQNAAILAREADSYLAGPAYAAEAALQWMSRSDPTLQERPIVVIGSSLGALSAPAAIARLRSVDGSRIDAAVLIGGGSGLLQITAASSIMRDRFTLLRMSPVPSEKNNFTLSTYEGEQLDELLEQATVASRLDPAHTAAALRDLPVLQLHATLDAIVPAARGDDLYERLGRPERWNYWLGHSGLFLMLQFEADDIARWITSRVPPPDAAPSTPPDTYPVVLP